MKTPPISTSTMSQEGRTIIQGRRPIHSTEDMEQIGKDARAGDAEAMRLMALISAVGLLGEMDWGGALDWLVASAERGGDEAQGELVVLSADEAYRQHLTDLVRHDQPFPDDVWRRLAQGVNFHALLEPPPARLMSQIPLIACADDVASPSLMAWLISRATPYLERALVVLPDKAKAFVDERRSNSSVGFNFSSSGLPLLALRQKIANLTGQPLEHLEPTNLLHYDPGQEFSAHYDSFPPDSEVLHARHAALGQRVFTLLIYLNDNYTGGATAFPKISLGFKGRAGQALFWRNTLQNSLEIEPLSLHAGTPPVQGSKWILSQWIRERPVPLYFPAHEDQSW